MSIAIVGMASVCPQARNLDEYWDNILNKVDSIIDVPPTHWKIEDYYDADPSAPDKTYCKRGGFLPDVEFDPLEFGLPPNILEVTDVSQLLGLVIARDALIDAGYYESTADVRDRTGVILGVGGGQKLVTPLTARLQYPVWERVLLNAGIPVAEVEQIIEKIKLAYIPWEENSFPGMLGNVIAGRITNRFDLGGINCVIDAACASSLAATKMAISELEEGRADMMITGGVDTDNSIFMYMNFSKTPALSKQDNIRPFDANTDGTMIGEAVAMLVLKRLEDAERDGDRIYATIKGIGTGSDGRYKSIYAPRSEGQVRVLKRAYDDAEISPATVGLIEAHGTGTVAGDICEFTSLANVFEDANAATQSVAIGSVKSQIGHTKSAAGAVSMIKVALALHHKVLPATINVEAPNPDFNIENTPFYINSETRPWIRGSEPRRAGVSSFGFGGTNYHVVLEEYEPEQSQPYRRQSVPQAMVVTGATPQELQANIQSMLTELDNATVKSFKALAFKGSIPRLAARIGFVAQSPEEAREMLQIAGDLLSKNPDAEQWEHPKGVYFRRRGMEGKVVALFPGQGSQYVNMGRELANNYPEIRAAFTESLADVVYPTPAFTDEERNRQEETLRQTENAQPAIGALSAGMYKLLQAAGFQPDFAAGHSFGELTALWSGGVLSDDDYFALTIARGQAMAPPNIPNFDAGGMLAVRGDLTALEAELRRLPEISIANYNSPEEVVLAGGTSAIQRTHQLLQNKGFTATILPVSAAFHTSLVGHAQKDFDTAIQTASFNPPRFPIFSNTTGNVYPADVKSTLSKHIMQKVQFKQEIENIYAAGGRVFVEIGPRSILTNLVKDILGDQPHAAIALNPSRRHSSELQFRRAIVQLQVLGVPIGDIDRYQAETRAHAPKRSGMKVLINGSNYISDKTRQAYEDALATGVEVPPKPTPMIIEDTPAVAEPMVEEIAATLEPAPQPYVNGNHLDRYQLETTQAHQQYLQTQTEFAREFLNLLQQQQALVQSGKLTPEALESLSTSINAFHAEQVKTLRFHEEFLQNQANQLPQVASVETASPVPVSTPIEPAPAVPDPSPEPVATQAPSTATVDTTPYAAGLLEIVSEKTGYPVEMLDLAMDIEADLGIDSIKRVEILGAMRTAFPELPQLNADDLAQLRTLDEIVVYMRNHVGANGTHGTPEAPPAPAVPDPSPEPVATQAPSTPTVDTTPYAAGLLEIVSEKTGYPAEMLDLAMDIEADLGIDSIKRVEILGAMRTAFPELPQLNADDLAQLRTLDEIVVYMRNHVGGNGTHDIPEATPAPAVPAAAAQAPSTPTVDTTPYAAGLLEIVSEKTGYPAEMLDLSMDIEADLGIDSIKRVEILGAMRTAFPELPQLNADDLAQLRTLDEIVVYMRNHVGGNGTHDTPEATPAPAVPAAAAQAPSTPTVDTTPYAEGLLAIVSEKTGYPADMLDLSMDIEADLGIDSIKRVEILGAMRTAFPELPQFNADDLAQLRTLQEIVDVMGDKKKLPQ